MKKKNQWPKGFKIGKRSGKSYFDLFVYPAKGWEFYSVARFEDGSRFKVTFRKAVRAKEA